MTTATRQLPSPACGFAIPTTRDSPGDLRTASLDELLALPHDPHGKHPHKDVLCLRDDTLPQAAPIFVKRQWDWDRRLPRWSDWRDGVSRDPDPVREARGLTRLRELGLSVPKPLRLIHDSRSGSPRAALLMSAVPAQRSLADWLATGDVVRLGSRDRRSLVVAIAGAAGLIHQHGLRWRSMKARHFYPQLTDHGDWRIWLIDCEGVRPRASRRQQRRDRQLLLRSITSAGSDEALLEMLHQVLDT